MFVCAGAGFDDVSRDAVGVDDGDVMGSKQRGDSRFSSCYTTRETYDCELEEMRVCSGRCRGETSTEHPGTYRLVSE